MPDEFELAKARLGRLGLPLHREKEIICELWEHLSDHAAALEAQGMELDAASRQSLASVTEWPVFREEILAAETEEAVMN